MNQPSTEQAIRDNEQLAELDVMYKEAERALVLIGDRMREIKNRLQRKPPVDEHYLAASGPRVVVMDGVKYLIPSESGYDYTKLAGGKYEK